MLVSPVCVGRLEVALTASPSSFSPLWNSMFGFTVMSHSVKSAFGRDHDSASHGCGSPSASRMASGSMNDEPTRLPASAHWLTCGFQPLVSAGTATTSLPPRSASPSGSSGVFSSFRRVVPSLVESVPLDPQAATSRAKATVNATSRRGATDP